LVFDPKKRITASASLKHGYFAAYEDDLLTDDLETKASISPFDWTFSNQELPAKAWKSKIGDMVAIFNAANCRDAVDATASGQD
jgi:hypothetical protein